MTLAHDLITRLDAIEAGRPLPPRVKVSFTPALMKQFAEFMGKQKNIASLGQQMAGTAGRKNLGTMYGLAGGAAGKLQQLGQWGAQSPLAAGMIGAGGVAGVAGAGALATAPFRRRRQR